MALKRFLRLNSGFPGPKTSFEKVFLSQNQILPDRKFKTFVWDRILAFCDSKTFFGAKFGYFRTLFAVTVRPIRQKIRTKTIRWHPHRRFHYIDRFGLRENRLGSLSLCAFFYIIMKDLFEQIVHVNKRFKRRKKKNAKQLKKKNQRKDWKHLTLMGCHQQNGQFPAFKNKPSGSL